VLGVVVFHDHVLLKYQSGILFANCSVEGCISTRRHQLFPPDLYLKHGDSGTIRNQIWNCVIRFYGEKQKIHDRVDPQ
jgi:hypothetical protein